MHIRFCRKRKKNTVPDLLHVPDVVFISLHFRIIQTSGNKGNKIYNVLLFGFFFVYSIFTVFTFLFRGNLFVLNLYKNENYI